MKGPPSSFAICRQRSPVRSLLPNEIVLSSTVESSGLKFLHKFLLALDRLHFKRRVKVAPWCKMFWRHWSFETVARQVIYFQFFFFYRQVLTVQWTAYWQKRWWTRGLTKRFDNTNRKLSGMEAANKPARWVQRHRKIQKRTLGSHSNNGRFSSSLGFLFNDSCGPNETRRLKAPPLKIYLTFEGWCACDQVLSFISSQSWNCFQEKGGL